VATGTCRVAGDGGGVAGGDMAGVALAVWLQRCS
jgi:hypothetical protein